MILATDQIQSFVIFIYGSLEWSISPLIGFNSGAQSYTVPDNMGGVDLEVLRSGSNFNSVTTGVHGYLVNRIRILENDGIIVVMLPELQTASYVPFLNIIIRTAAVITLLLQLNAFYIHKNSYGTVKLWL